METRGFTLLELLIVIAIIAVLAAAIVPAVSNMTVQAGQAKATSNLRQLVAAGLDFSVDHLGYLPNTYWGGTLASSSPPWDPGRLGVTRWYSEIHPYVYGDQMVDSSGNQLIDGVFRAPGLRGYEAFRDRKTTMSWERIDFINLYAYREGTDPTWKDPGRMNISRPASMPFLLMGYNNGTAGLTDEASFNQYCYSKEMGGSAPAAGLFPKGTAWVYKGSLLVGYSGGHVEAVPFDPGTNMYQKIFQRP